MADGVVDAKGLTSSSVCMRGVHGGGGISAFLQPQHNSGMLLNIMVVVALLAGRVYHLDFDPPAATTPGLAERLAVPAEPDCDPQQVTLTHPRLILSSVVWCQVHINSLVQSAFQFMHTFLDA